MRLGQTHGAAAVINSRADDRSHWVHPDWGEEIVWARSDGGAGFLHIPQKKGTLCPPVDGKQEGELAEH